jgi:hypothetical protein
VVFNVCGYPGSAEGLRDPYNLTTRGYPDFHCPLTPANSCVLAEAEQKQIVFHAFDPAQSSKRRIASTDIDGSDSFWDLSPDGSRIAFIKYDDDRGSIRILPLAGGRHARCLCRDRLLSTRWPGQPMGRVYLSRRIHSQVMGFYEFT